MLKIKDSVLDIKTFSVYKHTFPNGKVYIGITMQEPQKRWANGLGYNHNLYMKRAIKKYDWDNIKHEVLFENLTKEQAEKKEVELIAFYKSNNKLYGYNIDNGGNCIGKHSEDTKQKLKKYASNRPIIHNQNISKSKLGKKLNLTETQRLKISERFKGNKYGVGNKSLLWKHHTEETKLKMSLCKIGKPSWNKGKKRTLEHTINNVKSHQKAVLQFDKDMNFINEYVSIKIAMDKTNAKNISKCCRGEQKTSGGYIWKYKIKADLVEKVENE